MIGSSQTLQQTLRIGLLSLLLMWPTIAQPAERLDNGELRLEIDTATGLVLDWKACRPSCAASLGQMRFSGPADPPPLLPVATVGANPDLALAAMSGARYSLRPGGYRLEIALPGITPEDYVGVRLSTGDSFAKTGSEGFTGWSQTVNTFVLTEDGSPRLVPGREIVVPLTEARWQGLRNRFWVFACSALHGRGEPASLICYSGPIEHDALERDAPELKSLLFPDLWSWMRLLTLGLMYLFEALRAFVGSPALAIMGLAVAVKILMAPLTWLAGRWQREVNVTQTRLQPELDGIRRTYRGEEQVERVMALYRRHNVHPFYAIKSLFGVMIQIPVFIAAYHLLGQHIALDSASFLWCGNLAEPDHFWQLPFRMPFFGDHVNLLPLLMTAISLLAARAHAPASLSPQLRARSRAQLYLLATAFLVLFYTFPAGMVLYWTCNNLIELVRSMLSAAFSSAQ
jgi:YidC/Oxa1 family membrane protein insertase